MTRSSGVLLAYYYLDRDGGPSSVRSTSERTVVVDIAMENRTVTYNYREGERYYRDLPEWVDRYSFLPAPNEVSDDQRVCFVHVGE